jgi:hypothetical protein
MSEYDPIKVMAEAVARDAPSHLGKPAFPPLSWRVDENTLIVILADGRKIYASMNYIKTLLPDPKKKVEAPKLMTLPTKRDPLLPPANIKPDGKRRSSPQGDKSGK